MSHGERAGAAAPHRAGRHIATISVVIPVKDDAARLARCLSALQGQRRRADEILVVDNMSTDDSAAVAESHGARVVVCADRGIPAAAACGYDAALGDIILRLDADCTPGDWWIASIDAFFRDHPHAHAVTGPAHFHTKLRPIGRALGGLYLGAYHAVAGLALGHRPLFGSNMAMRRAAWHEVSGLVHRLDPEIHDDLDLSFHLGETHPLCFSRAIQIEISARPFHDLRALAVRFRRGARSVVVHWPRDFPPRRWLRRLTGMPLG